VVEILIFHIQHELTNEDWCLVAKKSDRYRQHFNVTDYKNLQDE
jgi:hypothetical protein